MVKHLFASILLLFSSALSAQLKPDKTVFDHGTIDVFRNDTAYFNLENTGHTGIHMLPTQPGEEYAILTTGKIIPAGGQITVAVVLYTDRTGNFRYNIPLYFSHSSKPLVLTVSGRIKSIDKNAFTVCPSIENSAPLKPAQKPLSVVVRDNNGNPLPASKVTVRKDNRQTGCVNGPGSIAFRCNIGYGNLHIKAEHPGFLPNEVEFRYNEKEYTCIIYLNPVAENREAEKDTAELPFYIPVAYNQKDSLPEQPAQPDAGKECADPGLHPDLFKPNHLIFIVDISGSMKDSSKLYYLKRSMQVLVSAIRPGDHVTLITYTNKVRTIFENQSGLNKDDILRAIDTLKAGGGSNGSGSLMLAYELAEKHFIPGGNNQVLIATDGLLNSSKISNEDLYRVAARNYRKSGVILSSIGFGRDEKAIAFLQKLAKNGRGNFIQIINLDHDLNKLLEEVKQQSRIK